MRPIISLSHLKSKWLPMQVVPLPPMLAVPLAPLDANTARRRASSVGFSRDVFAGGHGSGDAVASAAMTGRHGLTMRTLSHARLVRPTENAEQPPPQQDAEDGQRLEGKALFLLSPANPLRLMLFKVWRTAVCVCAFPWAVKKGKDIQLCGRENLYFVF